MKKRHFRNLFASWSTVSANILILFFLTPFLVYTLGDIRYGIWSLINSLVGYMGLADLGLRRSITKHINQYLAQENEHRAAQVVSTSLVLMLFVGIVIIGIAIILGFLFNRIFSGVSQEHIPEIRIAILLIGFQLSLGFITSVFKRAIESFNRFDLVNFNILATLIIKNGGFVAVLLVSPSLVGLAAVSLACQFILCVLLIIHTMRVWPNLQIHPSLFDKGLAREIRDFGIPTFLDNIAVKVIEYFDIILTGIFFSVEMVTIYSIGLMMIRYPAEFIQKITIILTPSFFKEAAVSNNSNLRYLLIKTVNTSALLYIPAMIGFMVWGDEFIFLWMGPGYQQSAVILFVISPIFLILPVRESVKIIILGCGSPRRVAMISIGEAVLKLIISITLVTAFKMGLVGLALGTTIAAFVTCMFLIIHACRLIDLPLRLFVIRTYGRWLIAIVLFAGMCLLVQYFIPSETWLSFWYIVVGLMLAYIPVGGFIVIDRQTRMTILQKVPFFNRIHSGFHTGL